MPSSSLILRSSATLVSILSLFSAPAHADDKVYSIVDTFKGDDFTNDNQWSYFHDKDPTHGFVQYVDRQSAQQQSLATVNNGVFKMDVEHANLPDTTTRGRRSVRIESKKNWYQGLFVADLAHMPASVCGSWPAWWLLGAHSTWPKGGEIDIVEGVSLKKQSLSALHVSGKSKIDGDNSDQTGTTQQYNCDYDDASFGANKNPTGCGILDGDTSSFGSGVQNTGGRVFAMEWTDEFIRVWSWAKGSVPSDLSRGEPKPETWGQPAQLFDGSDANIKSRFEEQKMIFDTTFCGDWAGQTWKDDGCIDKTGFQTCPEYVAYRGADFKDSYWEINSVKIYQKKNAPSTTTTTTITTTSSSTSSRSTTTTTTGTTTGTGSTSSTSSSSTSSTTSSSASSSTTTTSYSFHYGNGTTTYSETTKTYTLTTDTSSTSSTTSTSTTTKSRDSNKPQPTGDYTGWPHGGAPKPTGWADWEPVADPTFITTTITKTYVVPCETGLKTETATIFTSYVKGDKPYTPEVPSTTYVTTCPPEWGFGGPITVTIPVTVTKTGGDDWSNWGSNNDGKKTTTTKSADPSWSTWSSEGGKKTSTTKSSDPTWVSWVSTTTTSKKPDPASTWSGWESAKSTSTSKKPDPASSTWVSWVEGSSTSSKGVAAATGTGAAAQSSWDAWNAANGVQGVKTYTGAASKTVGTGLAGAVLAGVVALFLL